MAAASAFTAIFAVLTSGVARVVSIRLDARKYNGLKIIGAGLPRTGTESLDQALKALGYNTARGDSIENQSVREMWLSGNDVAKLDWLEKRGVEAVTDLPYCIQYEMLLRSFPSAKVILTVHPGGPTAWLRSQKEIVRNMNAHHPKRMPADWKMPAVFSPVPGSPECSIRWSEQTSAAGEVETCSKAYNSYTQRALATVPKDQILLFNVSQGWAPLCHFLGVAVPEWLPFPHKDGWGDENFRPHSRDSSERAQAHLRQLAQVSHIFSRP
mmetsp:Transcript_31300/g.89833  ORF Transcript_31300/g.89833 Transcript_31300/m.89833 type:complete len:269 (+) Transcript_31300:74-880(+)